MKYLPVLIGIVISFAVGLLAAALQNDALLNWYPLLNKSPLNPPNYIFPIAWFILYALMGISIGRLWVYKPLGYKTMSVIFAVQLILNFLWSITFFTMRSPMAAMVIIVLLFLTLIYYTYKCFMIDKISAALFIPYILWVAFAAYLNFYVVMNN